MDFASASTLTVAMSLGIAWHPVRAMLSHPLGISVRADLVADYQMLQYLDQHFDRWLPGVCAVVEPAWLFSGTVEAVVGIGLEGLFGAVDLGDQAGRTVAAWPPLRAVGEAGLRVGF